MTDVVQTAEGFCTLCGHIIRSFEGLTRCPNCGTESKPCWFGDQVTLQLNLHELRVLCIWAENWQNEKNLPHLVYGIANRLRGQLPGGLADLPLTIADELQKLREIGIEFETDHPAADQ